jgi:hypothetical protein
VEATVRYAAELGYEVTMVKDATADYSDVEMHAALDVNIPNYASAIVNTNEIVASLSSLNVVTSVGREPTAQVALVVAQPVRKCEIGRKLPMSEGCATCGHSG